MTHHLKFLIVVGPSKLWRSEGKKFLGCQESQEWECQNFDMEGNGGLTSCQWKIDKLK
jgi:hypothetical protein